MNYLRTSGFLLFCFFQVIVVKSQSKADSVSRTVFLDTVFVNFLNVDTVGHILLIDKHDQHFVDVLSKGKGVFKVQEQNYPLVIRGVVGSRVRIERNGQLMTGFDQTGYLADDINTKNLNTVQLIHGARSVTYGNGGIGGVLLVEEGAVLFRKRYSTYAGFSSNNQQRTIGLKIEETFRNSGLNISGQYKKASNFHYADRSEAEHSRFDAANISFSYGFKKKNIHFEWRNSWHSSDWERPRGFQNNPLELRNLRNRYRINSDAKLNISLNNGLTLENRIWYNGYDIDQSRENFASDFSTINSLENRNYVLRSYGFRSTLNGEINSWDFQLGADYYKLNFEEKRTEQDLRLGTPLLELDEIDRSDLVGGAFGLLEKRKNKYHVLFTVRGDLAKLGSKTDRNIFSNLTAGAQFGYNVNSFLNNSISISRHFRYPETIESTGVFSGGRGVFYGNADIDPETSYNIEWNFNGQVKNFGYVINLWASLITNRITEVLLSPGEYTYQNILKSRIEGLDYRLTYQFPNLPDENSLKFEFSGSFIRGSEVESFLESGVPLVGIPPSNVKFQTVYKRTINEKNLISITAGINRIGNFERLPEDVVRAIWGVNEAEAYLLIDMGLSYVHKSVKRTFSAGAKIMNLTDQGYFPFGTHIMGKGRDLNLFLKIDF